jgi:hypothetical protein
LRDAAANLRYQPWKKLMPSLIKASRTKMRRKTSFALFCFGLLSTPLAFTGQLTQATNHGTITVTGYTGPGGAVNIPTTVTGLPVTTIGDFAFKNRTNITSVTIPASVTTVGMSAFVNCTSLTNVLILNGVTSLGYNAFGQCTSLTSFIVPGSVTTLGDFLFAQCYSLTNVTILNGVPSVGNGMFNSCAGLTSVSIPGSVTNIGLYAFYLCTRLTSLVIPASVSSISNGAFQACSSLGAVFFKGKPPSPGSEVFGGSVAPSAATVYYLPGTTGWASSFGDRPTSVWNPLMQPNDHGCGIGPAGFGSTRTGTASP